jgi:uncharacterized membrane protein YdbT with pleckstrin-like domain
MGYIKKALAEGEVVRFYGKPHWIIWVRAWAALIVLGVLLIGLIIFIRDLVFMTTTEVAITNRRLILKRGLVGRKTSELELTTVEAVKLDQDVMGRLFGWGRLEVHGTGDDVWLSPLIAAPVAFRKQLESALIAISRPPAKSAA